MKFAVIILLVIIGFTSCGAKQTAVESESVVEMETNIVELTDAQIKNAGITLGMAKPGTMQTTIKVSGVVDVPPQNMISISFPLGGYLKYTQLLEGMRVRKGQVIAVMEDQGIIQLQQDFLIAQSKSYFLQKEFERQKLLNENKSTSDKVFEQVAGEYKMAQIQVSSLGEKLKLIGLNPAKISEKNISRSINIYAPITGYVSAVNVNIGKFVNPSDILFELVNPSDLHLALQVFEKDIHSINIGQKIKAYMANNPQKVFDAEVILVSKNLDANRSAIVHCHFEHTEHELLPGMFLNAEIQINQNNALLVPSEAVVRSGEKQYIFLHKNNNQFQLFPVNTGNTANGKTEILTPRTEVEGKEMITANAYAALMKMQNKSEE